VTLTAILDGCLLPDYARFLAGLRIWKSPTKLSGCRLIAATISTPMPDTTSSNLRGVAHDLLLFASIAPGLA
jgi:hypothetical protein